MTVESAASLVSAPDTAAAMATVPKPPTGQGSPERRRPSMMLHTALTAEREPTDADIIAEIPDRFIAAEKGNVPKGQKRWIDTVRWRRENRIANILKEPHRLFKLIKQHYPHWYHGRSKNNNPVYIEQPGKINLKELKKAGVKMEDLLRHYMYITEFLWVFIEPTEEGRCISVLDVQGIGMRDVGGEVLDYIRAAAGFTGQHYPERCAHIYIVNVPSWFSWVWNIIKPMIDPVTRAKTHIVRGKQQVTDALWSK